MSWSFGFVSGGTLSAFDSALADAKATFITEQESFGSPISEDTDSQINAAGTAARQVMSAQCCGDTSYTFNVVLTGHANPNHEPVVGQPPDAVSVSVVQVP